MKGKKMSDNYKRIIKIISATNKVSITGGTPNYGCAGLIIRFILSDDDGAIVFDFYTQAFLPEVLSNMIQTSNPFLGHPRYTGWVSAHKRYAFEGCNNGISEDNCIYLPSNTPCYLTNFSQSLADEIAETLARSGDDSVWYRLKDVYERCTKSK